MLKLNNLSYSKGSVFKKKRWRGSKTFGRGTKGQKSRSGYSRDIFRSGGQTRVWRSIPKFGFVREKYKKKYDFKLINLNLIDKKFSNNEIVSFDSLKDKKIVLNNCFKIVSGELTKPLTFDTNNVSKSIKNKVIEAGGSFVI